MKWIDKLKTWFRPRQEMDRDKFIENVGEDNINKLAQNMRDNIKLDELYDGPYIEESEDEPEITVAFDFKGLDYGRLPYDEVMRIAESKGITIEQAARNIMKNKIEKDDYMDSFIRVHEENKPDRDVQEDKMQALIDKKKNRTPFYKDEDKKNWE